jgi:hypothetical protein
MQEDLEAINSENADEMANSKSLLKVWNCNWMW